MIAHDHTKVIPVLPHDTWKTYNENYDILAMTMSSGETIYLKLAAKFKQRIFGILIKSTNLHFASYSCFYECDDNPTYFVRQCHPVLFTASTGQRYQLKFLHRLFHRQPPFNIMSDDQDDED